MDQAVSAVNGGGSLGDRLKIAIENNLQPYRRFAALSSMTGIPADRWKAFFLGRQRPTEEMIEGICKAWPQHAFWLTTGHCDSAGGHIAPLGVVAVEITRMPVMFLQIAEQSQ
jgi:hypothetical protein